jgi:hypothetical protein
MRPITIFEILLILTLLYACTKPIDQDNGVTASNLQVKENAENAQTQQQLNKSSLNEFQAKACNTADKEKTCDRLISLKLVTIEQCCQQLNKCCGIN